MRECHILLSFEADTATGRLSLLHHQEVTLVSPTFLGKTAASATERANVGSLPLPHWFFDWPALMSSVIARERGSLLMDAIEPWRRREGRREERD